MEGDVLFIGSTKHSVEPDFKTLDHTSALTSNRRLKGWLPRESVVEGWLSSWWCVHDDMVYRYRSVELSVNMTNF